MRRKGSAPILILLIIVAALVVGGIWYYEARRSTQPLPVAPVPSPTSTANANNGREQSGPSAPTSSYSSAKISLGVAECPSVVTSTAEDRGGSITNKYTLYENSSTGISFCYPSYLTIRVETSTKPSIPLIIWPSGKTLEFYPSNEMLVAASSVVDKMLSACEVGGPHGELSCVPPKGYQIIHAQNQNGFSFSVFWTDTVNSDAVPTSVYNSSTGPFAYVDTPGDQVVFIPGISSPSPTSIIQDLTVILNTLDVTKPPS